MFRKNHIKIYQTISSFYLEKKLNLINKGIISSGKIRNSGNYIHDYAHSFFMYIGLVKVFVPIKRHWYKGSVAFAWYKYSDKTNVHRQTLRRSFLCISGVSSSAIPTNDLSVIYNNLFFFSNKIGYFDVADSHNSPLRTNLVNHVLGHVYMFILS